MNNPIVDIVAGVIRWILAAAFGSLVAKGYITENNLLLAAGIIAVAVLSLLSSVWSKIKAKYNIDAARVLPPTATEGEIVTLANENLAAVSSITKVLP
jgi:hypothetical protein